MNTKTETAAVETEAKAPNAISAHIRNYRASYVPTLGVAGRGSLDNDDSVAKALRTMEPTRVMTIAESLLSLNKGELATRYAERNAGMKRMNSGNLIRNALKRGDITNAAIKTAIKKIKA